MCSILVADFRPISCCNVIYKIITKILVLRIRGVLDKIISQSQTAFVPGRSISDNVLLAQELFSGYNQCRLPPRCALKVDLRKAYDTVEWIFLLAMLQLFGFPPTFNRWIEECVTSPHFSFIPQWRGTWFLYRARGLRQGDPVSPYLFVLVMEVLHLILRNLLSRMVVLPIIGSKIDARIHGWDGVGLSFAGRVQLIKSVLLAFEVYWAMAFLLPKGVIKEIVKRIRTFLWKGNSSSGYPKVAWESVCKPIEEGGQGIRDILALNRALMSRHLWSVIKHEKESKWVDWIAHYRLRDASIWTINAKRGAWSCGRCLSYEIIQNLPPIHTGRDVITWDSNGGEFTNAAAYHLFRPPGPKVLPYCDQKTHPISMALCGLASCIVASGGPRPDGEERNFHKFQHKIRAPSTIGL
ncbi:UNVERIFIED_CONTAM: Retrovirus-related Pol polyprotein from type-2 retrotransposable element R2DM [Sesamum radiatum]|uniref:Retrovirus-related Pol polyprotein from type-2 retrotransposable element R2DM n=1 Tax=Sesamum radiatum TaxID=300843 RepID=A0AAW2SKV2_SESRA